MIPYNWLIEAKNRLAPHIRKTPLTHDPSLNLFLKWENHQVTGSFKVRGAINKVLSLNEWERAHGLIAASAGNHGLGVALAGKMCGAPVTIFIPNTAPPVKFEAIQSLGARIKLVAGDYAVAERTGVEYAVENQATWISPYNDGQVIAGQATLGLECLSELPESESLTWIIPVGGGGLIAGISTAITSTAQSSSELHGKHYLVGVQSQASPFFHAIYNQIPKDEIQEMPTIADGLAGAIEENAITIPIVQRYVDNFILVSEDEIREAIAYAWINYRERIEGSAGVALAAILSGKISARPALVIISGGNIQPELHDEIIGAATHA